jgi:hypothetical protein
MNGIWGISSFSQLSIYIMFLYKLLMGVLTIFQRYREPQDFSTIYEFSCLLVHLNQHDLYTMTP